MAARGARRPQHLSHITLSHHPFQASFSAGSTPIFASKYAFFSIFRDLQEYHLLASKFCKFLQNFCKKFAKILQNLQKFSEFFKILKILPNFCQNFAKILPKFCKICSREDDFLVDLEKCCKMRPWLPKSASI